MEIIILAGGKGSRLLPITENIPKPMVEIGGTPFLELLLKGYSKKGIDVACLAIGYKKEVIIDYFSDWDLKLKLIYSVEQEVLGTGGALLNSLPLLGDEDVFVTNGDTFFDLDFGKMMKFHINNKSDVTVAVRTIRNYNRYGTILTDQDSRIVGFKDKVPMEEGLVNCGTYLVKRNSLESLGLPNAFSFETQILESDKLALNRFAFSSEGYFIDIGVHADLERARKNPEIFT